MKYLFLSQWDSCRRQVDAQICRGKDKLTAIRSRVPFTAAHRSCRRSITRMNPTPVDDKLEHTRRKRFQHKLNRDLLWPAWWFKGEKVSSTVNVEDVSLFVFLTWKQPVLQPNDRQEGNSCNTRALRGGKKSSMAQKWSQVPVHRFQFCCAALYLLRQLAPSIKGDTVKRLQISWPPAPSPHFPHSPALLCGPSRNGEGMGKHWQQLLTAARAVYQQNPIYTTWNMCILFQVVVKHCHYLSSRNIPVSFKYLFSHLSFCNYWLQRQGGSN